MLLDDLFALIKDLRIIIDQIVIELSSALFADEHGLPVYLGEEGQHAALEAEDEGEEVEGAAHQDEDED